MGRVGFGGFYDPNPTQPVIKKNFVTQPNPPSLKNRPNPTGQVGFGGSVGFLHNPIPKPLCWWSTSYLWDYTLFGTIPSLGLSYGNDFLKVLILIMFQTNLLIRYFNIIFAKHILSIS